MSIFRTIRLPAAYLVAVGLALGAPLLLLAFVTLQGVVPTQELVRDPLAVAASAGETRRYFGAASQAGVLLWAGTAGMAGAAGLLLALDGRRGDAGLLLGIAGYTAFLAADDALMLHEMFGRRVGGVPLFKTAYLAGMLGVGAGLLARLRRVGVVTLALYGAAGACFAGSILADDLLPQAGSVFLIEDGLKLAGLGCWSGLVIDLAVRALRPGLVPPSPILATLADGLRVPVRSQAGVPSSANRARTDARAASTPSSVRTT